MNDSQQDFRISAVTKLKHGDLYAAAIKLGSQSELARRLDIQPTRLGEWINMKKVPTFRTEDDRALMDAKLLLHVGKGLDELFPEWYGQCTEFLKSNKTAIKTVAVKSAALLEYAGHTRQRLIEQANDVTTVVAQKELKDDLLKSLKALSYREREVIKLRYGLGDGSSYTLEEVAHIFKVTRERIREIEAKAVRKLQQPNRANKLVGHLD